MKHKPREIRWSLYCMIVLIVINVAMLFILLAHHQEISQNLVQSIELRNPSYSSSQIQGVVQNIFVNRNILHVVVILCWAVLAYLIYRAKNWGRILLVIFTILSFVGSIYAFSTAPYVSLQVLAVIAWLGRIVLLWLLLVPLASRHYFRTS
ncbi:MAG: hypothetical protein V4481_04010 [Patescibacteria group bacterium]